MKVLKTVKLEMTEEERGALETVYRMLYNLSWEDERVVANELDYSNLEPTRNDLARLYELGGGDMEDLE